MFPYTIVQRTILPRDSKSFEVGGWFILTYQKMYCYKCISHRHICQYWLKQVLKYKLGLELLTIIQCQSIQNCKKKQRKEKIKMDRWLNLIASEYFCVCNATVISKKNFLFIYPNAKLATLRCWFSQSFKHCHVKYGNHCSTRRQKLFTNHSVTVNKDNQRGFHFQIAFF